MRIEVATTRSLPTKDKGDLLEILAKDLLQAQSYATEREVRRTASELDLLCTHKINGRQVYVECKAHRDPLSSSVLHKLLGKVTFADYAEGWLVSAGPLGKDAKGFQVEWESKTPEQRARLSIYTPQRVIDTLREAKLVVDPSQCDNPSSGEETLSFGDWTLLITEHGRFWVQVVLISGAPEAVQVFSAEQGEQIIDPILLRRLAATDSTLTTLDFEYGSSRGRPDSYRIQEDGRRRVVQMQHGESWSDYRPSRPEDFVGRKPAQDSILRFLDSVRSERTTTRVFAITGDSGMGKSSLIAKLRNRTRNISYRNKFFLYAVDVRAATRPSYILWSLLACLRQAIDSGFIEFDVTKLEISDYSEPLSSKSVAAALNIAREQRRVVCLVFDQFEELYSKPEVFPVFEEAQRFLLSAASAETSLALGFAWRTDSTVQQDHPAYFMWHRLADHRLEVSIGPFEHSEASNAITVFERELRQKLPPAIRRQIVENSQGYPWLLKKLCIHLYGQLQSGEGQAKLVDTLDVATLFEDDLKALSSPEQTCLEMIAAQAPADWHEVLEAAGAETLRALQDKRLIVRSGDRINLYWDLFREYVLTGEAPSVPFTYVALASVGALLEVAEKLTHESGQSFDELSRYVGLKATTVQNIVHDLVMFRVAQDAESGVVLHPEIGAPNRDAILERIRTVLRSHALYLALTESDDGGSEFGLDDLIASLQRTNPTAHHRNQTWKTYAERIAQWLCVAGLLRVVSGGWVLHDYGRPVPPDAATARGKRRGVQRKPFQAEAPPERVIACLEWIRTGSEKTRMETKRRGYRNAAGVLMRFGLIQLNRRGAYVGNAASGNASAATMVWRKAWQDQTLRQVLEWLMTEGCSIPGWEVGERLGASGAETWTAGSKKRVGSGLRRWALWMMQAEEGDEAPPVPRKKTRKGDGGATQEALFEN